jgi:purine-nucleoside phosphorylase
MRKSCSVRFCAAGAGAGRFIHRLRRSSGARRDFLGSGLVGLLIEWRCPNPIGMRLEASEYLSGKLGNFLPRVGIVLGSGLGFFADEAIEPVCSFDYADIPGFPVSTVEGHAGRLVCGHVGPSTVICLQGRFHYYEGYSLAEVTLPIRVMKELGVETLLLTNAAGGIRKDLEPGDLMLLTDHINCLGQNPLRGANENRFGPRFPDMSVPYGKRLRALAHEAATACGVRLKEGIYACMAGPSFETPAEVRALGVLGADAVGMSTVPECIVARHCGIRVGAISCITNHAAGLGAANPLSHGEVAETADRVREPFAQLLAGWAARAG